MQLLEKVLEESGNDLEVAINNLNALHLGDLKCSSGVTVEENSNMEKGMSLRNRNVFKHVP